VVDECRNQWAAEGREWSFDELVWLAEQAPALRSFVDPNDPALLLPGDMPRRIRDACAASGQEVPEGEGAVVRCIFESLALKYRQTIELLRSATGLAPSEVHVVGGGAGNELLCRLTASATGLPVLAGPAEATVVGNLGVQAMASGELGSLEELREVVARSFPLVSYVPVDEERW